MERWTYTANSQGYMFYFDGKPTGGAGTMSRPPGRYTRKQAKSYADYCRAECARRNARGELPRKPKPSAAETWRAWVDPEPIK